jgi:hypothetical protein
LRVSTRGILRGLLCGELRSQFKLASCGLCGQLCFSRRLLRRQFRQMCGFHGARCFSHSPGIFHPGGFSFFTYAAAIRLEGFYGTLARFFPGLRARSREIPVLGAV